MAVAFYGRSERVWFRMASTVWKGQLTFGMVSIPVRLVRAARKERIKLRYVRELPSGTGEPDDSRDEDEHDEPSRAISESTSEPAHGEIVPVRQTYVAQGDDESFSPAQLQRGYEVAPEQFVVVQPEELRRLRKATSPDMQVLRSVKLQEIDPVFLETSYYVLPAPAGERPYALFFRALSETNLATLAQVTMHGRDHIIVIRAGSKGLIAHTMFYMNEVRLGEEYATDAGECRCEGTRDGQAVRSSA